MLSSPKFDIVGQIWEGSLRTIVLALGGLALSVFLVGQSRPEESFHPRIPEAWNDTEVETYELPLSYGANRLNTCGPGNGPAEETQEIR